MTRTYTTRPIWTWQCDECGFETGDLSRQQYGLPSIEVMRNRGWFIADLFGDKCPACQATTTESEAAEVSGAWRCSCCGSARWVGWASSPGGPRKAQCVPCGRVSALPTESETNHE